jgi:hypothetical protein
MRIQSKNGRLSSFLLGGLCLVVASAASASHPTDGEAAMGACPQHIFDMSDTDGDNALSPEEFAASELERYGVDFDDYDVDGDGFTSFDEYLDFFEAHHPPEEMI